MQRSIAGQGWQGVIRARPAHKTGACQGNSMHCCVVREANLVSGQPGPTGWRPQAAASVNGRRRRRAMEALRGPQGLRPAQALARLASKVSLMALRKGSVVR